MAYTRTSAVDSAPGGDSVKQAILDLDTDLTGAFAALNALEPTLTGSTADIAPADADTVYGGNAGSAFATIKTTWTVVKAFLKTYFDAIYSPIAGPGVSQSFSVGALSVAGDITIADGKLLKFGTGVAANTATAGVTGATPNQTAGYLIAYVDGLAVKIPFYNY